MAADCCMCRSAVAAGSGRRILYPITASSVRCYKTLITLGVSSSLLRSSAGVVYSCKRCYSKLDKISKSREALSLLTEEINKMLRGMYSDNFGSVHDATTQTEKVSYSV